MTPNLHELANTPGAGKARAALMAAGHWRWRKEELLRWTVRVSLSVATTAFIDVAASSEAAARKLAREFDEWDVDGDVEDVQIDSITRDTDPIGEPRIVEGEE